MEKFGELLKLYMKEQKLAVNAAAATFGVNRGGLYNIIGGRRTMPEDTLRTILKSDMFTAQQKAGLREAYYAEMYSDEKWEKIKFIVSTLDALTDRKDELCTAKPLETDGEAESIIGRSAVLQAVSKIFALENEAENGEIITNFSFGLTEVDDQVFAWLQKSRKSLKFSHIIAFDSENKTVNNLQNVFSSLRYVRNGYVPQYFYFSYPYEKMTVFPYVYYIASGSMLLLFDETATSGFLTSEKSVVASTFLNIRQKLSRLTPLAQIFEDEIEFKSDYGSEHSEDFFAFHNYPCFGIVSNRELIEAAARPDLPARDAMIEFYYTHTREQIKIVKSYNYKLWVSTCGIREFAETGRLCELSDRLVVALPREQRATILKGYLKFFQDDPEICVKLFDDGVRLPFGSEFQAMSDRLFLFCSMENDPHSFAGQAFIRVTDSGIASDFKAFTDYVNRSGLCLENDEAVLFLQNLISQLENGQIG